MWSSVLALFAAFAVPGLAQPPDFGSPLVGIGLSVNDETETTVWPGVPLTFVAVLQNSAAVEAVAATEMAGQVKLGLETAVNEGRVTREEADAYLDAFTAPPAAAPLTVAATADRFTWVLADGSRAPVQPALAAGAAATVLDGETDLAVTFTLAPEATSALAPGELRLRLRYNGEGAPAGEWRGIAESDEAIVTVETAPAPPSPEQQWRASYALSQFHLARGEHDAAATAAEAMLATTLEPVTAYVQLGRAREGQNDLAAALKAYEDGLAAFREASPEACAPLALMRMAQRVGETAEGGQPAPTDRESGSPEPPGPPGDDAATANPDWLRLPSRGARLQDPPVRADYTAPAGWAVSDEGDLRVLTPPDVPAGATAALTLPTVQAVDADYDAWFAARWKAVTEGFVVENGGAVLRRRTAGGLHTLYTTAQLKDPDGSTVYILFFTGRAGGRAQSGAFATDSKELMDRHLAPVTQFLETLVLLP